MLEFLVLGTETTTVVGVEPERAEEESFAFITRSLLMAAVEVFLAFLGGFSEELAGLECFRFDFEVEEGIAG
jgi:hypothetical protein